MIKGKNSRNMVKGNQQKHVKENQQKHEKENQQKSGKGKPAEKENQRTKGANPQCIITLLRFLQITLTSNYRGHTRLRENT